MPSIDCRVCDGLALDSQYFFDGEGTFKINFPWAYGPLCPKCYENFENYSKKKETEIDISDDVL